MKVEIEEVMLEGIYYNELTAGAFKRCWRIINNVKCPSKAVNERKISLSIV